MVEKVVCIQLGMEGRGHDSAGLDKNRIFFAEGMDGDRRIGIVYSGCANENRRIRLHTKKRNGDGSLVAGDLTAIGVPGD